MKMSDQQQQPVLTIPDVIITPENSPQPVPVITGNQRIIDDMKKQKGE